MPEHGKNFETRRVSPVESQERDKGEKRGRIRTGLVDATGAAFAADRGTIPRRRRRREIQNGLSQATLSAATVPASGRRLSHASACLFPRARYTLPPACEQCRVFYPRVAPRPIRKEKSLAAEIARSVVRARRCWKGAAMSLRSDETDNGGLWTPISDRGVCRDIRRVAIREENARRYLPPLPFSLIQ